MPRSATDATRFTSTTPHVSAIPPKTLPPRSPGPPGETPQEKVRRLRAAANKARDAQVTSFDRLIIRGRAWADTAHKITTLTLIGATVLATGVTIYALGDMMIYNRKKKAQFFEEQKAKLQSAIFTARRAIEEGTATPEQINFIKMEDEHQAKLLEKKNKKGAFAKGKEWLFSGLKKEEEGEDFGTSERRLGYEALSEEDDSLGERESDVLRAIEDKKLSITAKAKQAFAEEKDKQRTGGPLDRLGTATEDDPLGNEPPKANRGWTSWFNTKR